MAEHGYHIEMAENDFRKFERDFPDWVSRHQYNMCWALDKSAVEMHLEFCAFHDLQSLFDGLSMGKYPKLDRRKNDLKTLKGDPTQDFVGNLAGFLDKLHAKKTILLTNEEAQYRYNQDPGTKGIWWMDTPEETLRY